MATALIGGAFLNASVQTLIDKLTSREFRDYIKNTKLNESLMEEMERSLLALMIVLDDADEKQIHKPTIKEWLDRLKDAIFDAEDLLDQIRYNALRCKKEKRQAGSIRDMFRNLLSTTSSSNGEINSEVEKMCKKLQYFVQQKDLFGLQQTVSGGVSRRTPSSSMVNESVMVGRNDDKDRLINMLVSDCGTSRNNNLNVVAIWGMGGVGKTTFAQLVYNDEKVGHHFELKAWVCVSEDFDVMRVTKFLLESVVRDTTSDASKVWESNNLDILRVELKKNLREKRFLFVLDDMWNKSNNDWVDLVSPFVDGKAGSSVIITTREKEVADMAHALHIHQLKLLSHEDCWSLLSKHAFRSDELHNNKNKDLEEIGKKIARKCDGLPLAAKTLGGLLRARVGTTEWTAILNSNVWNLQDNKIIPALHLSYQYLPSHLKRCFSYCSIFPKDYPLDRKHLVLMWMAEGFIDCSLGGKVAEEVGDDCFAELLSRSLIQQSNDDKYGPMFSMHDLVNDLATFVSGSSCCRFECDGINKNIPKNVRHFSYSQEAYDIFKKLEGFNKYKSLRSFLPIGFSWRRYNLSIKVVDDLLPRLTMYNLSIKVVDDLLLRLTRLRMLSLSGYGNITKLPDSIGDLVLLRYLNLSRTKIKTLPDTTCNLYNLQTLILCKCWDLTELPLRIGSLISLCHLDISDTNIKELPLEIARLENLQILAVFVVGKGHVGLSIKEFGKFPHLQGKRTIVNLHNVVDVTEEDDAILKNKEQIEELELQWKHTCEDSHREKVVLDKLQPSEKLKKLSINAYGGTRFPCWLGNSSFSNMVFLHISRCENCGTLPPLGQLCSLKKLRIEYMKMLETIGPEFYYVQGGEGSNSCFQPFPSLKYLEFHKMPVLKEWFPFEGNNFAFPRLKILKLLECPELKGNLPSHLSSLEELKIKGCKHLMETSTTLHWLLSIKKIEIVGGFNEEGNNERSQLSLVGSGYPCRLQDVVICNCDKLSLPTMILRSTCLQSLELNGIPSLTAFPMDGLPTSLKSLTVSGCRNLSFLPMKTWRNYTLLVSLKLRGSCDALTSFPLDGFPALEKLEMDDCKNMKSIYISECPSSRPSCLRSLKITSYVLNYYFEVNIGKEKLPALEELYLNCLELLFCEGFCLPPKLRSIHIWYYRTITWPPVSEWGFEGLTALSKLKISCDEETTNRLLKESLLPFSLVSLEINTPLKMNSIGGNGLRHLSSLETLSFLWCSQFESWSEVELMLPSSLKSFQFSYCNSLVSLSGFTMPSSLETLQFQSCGSLVSLSGFTMPSSLKSLLFKSCDSLVSLSGFTMPSSLETLQFQYCKNLESLPEDNIPSSLKILTIYQCPLLEERYKKNEHWSKIAHIPVIKINDQLTI